MAKHTILNSQLLALVASFLTIWRVGWAQDLADHSGHHLAPQDLLCPNGRYRIPSTGPDPNPFVSIRGARGEIYAYGFRNPQRMRWGPVSNSLIADDIGLHSWEEVDIVTKGSNYGYAEREGPEQLFVGGPSGGKTGSQIDPHNAFPGADLLNVDGIVKPVTPIYPVAVYSHQDGGAIGSGFVYRGKLLPQLVGRYIFSDITTARLSYVDLAAMFAGHGVRNKQAEIHELQVMYRSPYGASVKRRMYDIVADGYAHKEGKANPDSPEGVLPGTTRVTGGCKAKCSSQAGLIHRVFGTAAGAPTSGWRWMAAENFTS